MSSCSVARLLAVAFAVSWLNVTLSSSSPSPLDKCVNIRLDDSQRIYLTGSGQKGSVGPRGLPGKIGPKGEKGEQGLRGIVGLRGVKGSKGDDSGITDLENRLAAAERLITELMEFRQNITETAGCLLTTFSSCKAALTTGCSNDGIYYLQPPGVQTRFTAFCDQTTDGGGWMLQYAYKHKGGENNPQVKALPTDPNGYSHQHLQSLGIRNGWAKEVRFYCTSSSHNRVLHFKTSNAKVLDNSYLGGQQTTKDDWRSGTTKLNGHTAYIPDGTTDIGPNCDGFIRGSPFYGRKDGNYYIWLLHSIHGARFECDDHLPGNRYGSDTLHRVFVRN